MSFLQDGQHLSHDRIRTPEQTRHEAALYVCSRATDVDDAAQILQALGLLEYRDDQEASTPGARRSARSRATKPGLRKR